MHREHGPISLPVTTLQKEVRSRGLHVFVYPTQSRPRDISAGKVGVNRVVPLTIILPTEVESGRIQSQLSGLSNVPFSLPLPTLQSGRIGPKETYAHALTLTALHCEIPRKQAGIMITDP